MPAATQPLRQFMTLAPHYVAPDLSVPAADASMRELGIGHLPVVEDGALVGLLSSRDLAALTRLGMDTSGLDVARVMRPSPFTAAPDDEITAVAREMARQHHECAVITEASRVVGILTSSDALVLLAEAAAASATLVAPTRLPSAIQGRVEQEHARLEKELAEVESWCAQAIESEAVARELPNRANDLCLRLRAHHEFEDELLGPLLRQSLPGGARSDELVERHGARRAESRTRLLAVESAPSELLLDALLQLVAGVRAELHEVQALFANGALDDNVVQSDVAAG
jgi:CBS domain-containing protein